MERKEERTKLRLDEFILCTMLLFDGVASRTNGMKCVFYSPMFIFVMHTHLVTCDNQCLAYIFILYLRSREYIL